MSECSGDSAQDEEPKPTTEPTSITTEISKIFQLIQQHRDEDKLERSQTKADIADLRSALSAVQNTSPMSFHDSPIINRMPTTRRTSMFFGSPAPTSDTAYKTNVQVLQHDIVYDWTLQVSSLLGLQCLSQQRLLLSSKYPNHQISLARMVSPHLRQHVLLAYNHLWYKDSEITGSESQEIMADDWLSLSNAEIQAILVEAARPRTRELCARELILFLKEDIPQSPPVNPDNFSKLFYGPMVKSLTDLEQLCALLSADTSPYSNNLARMPVPGYGTKECPGQIQIWIISLGSQKEAILHWLGKDNLVKHKTLTSAIKYIRSKFMEARHHSELRRDFDAKLTPIRYDDLNSTQGESYTRMQPPTVRPPPVSQNSSNFRHQHHRSPESSNFQQNPTRSSLNALNFSPDDPDIDEPAFADDDDDDMTHLYVDTSDQPCAATSTDHFVHHDLSAIATPDTRNNVRQAIAATYQGYCSELFVLGTCPRQNNNCPFDHSAPALERCIRSFTLLSKRELQLHGQLPPWSTTNKDTSTPPRGPYTSNRPDKPPTFTRDRDNAPDRNYGTYQQSKPYNK